MHLSSVSPQRCQDEETPTDRLGAWCCPVLAVSKCVKHDETWNTVLKHVGVKIWCGTCRCDTGTQCWVHWVNVKAAHFGARMPKRRPPGGGGHAKQDWKVAFWGWKRGWNGLKFSWDSPSLQARFGEATKRERQGDNLTSKQNVSTTIETWRLGTAAISETSDLDWPAVDNCILSLLLRPAIQTEKLWTPFSLYSSSGLTSCGWLHWWLALHTSKWSEDCTHQHKARCPNCRRHVLFTCQIVTLSLSFCCFTECSNLSTQTWGFCMPVHGTGGPGGCNHVEMIDLEAGIVPWKFQAISSTFSPSKSHFSVLFGMPPPSRWPPFEHSSTKMGSLDIDPVYSTLCPRITLTRPTSNFHSNMLQYSVSGLVMLDAFTYGKDCICRRFQSLAIPILFSSPSAAGIYYWP